ncbi:phosphomannomutase/phosphoglucomutase [Candidatus Woesebacteria bacterium]|nr:phosphomannomutase/phosphoglucomutase [Candidatus Woesebacteria bacterium]
MINPKIFKAYDIRSTYPDEINEEAVELIARGIYAYFAKKLNKQDMTICVGHDMRFSSPSLYHVMTETLKKQGVKVIRLGLVSTPTVYFATKTYGYDVGIQISASHNPKEYNGVKFLYRDGDALIKIGQTTGMHEVKDVVMHQQFLPYQSGGSVEEKSNVITEETQQALDAIQPISLSGLTVVSDPANAMGILPLTELFKHLEAKHIMINETLDGTFPAHQADPLQHKTLRQLQDAVVKEHTDIGIAMDGDADRVMFIDEKGEIVPATLITALIAREILSKKPGELILVDVRYTRNVEHVVTKHKGKVHFCRIGHALITDQVNKEGAIFAGESSGHYYFQSMGGTESSMRVVLYVLNVLAREQKPFSEIMKELSTSEESGEVNYTLPDKFTNEDILAKLKEQYADGKLNTLDGIAIDFPTWRLSVRFSNTEPLLRLNVEADTKEELKKAFGQLKKYLLSLGLHAEE